MEFQPTFNPEQEAENKKEKGEQYSELTDGQINERIRSTKKRIESDKRSIETFQELKTELKKEAESGNEPNFEKKVKPVDEKIEERESDIELKKEKIKKLEKEKIKRIKSKIERIKEMKKKREDALEKGGHPNKITKDMKKEVDDFEEKIKNLNNELESYN